MTTSTADDVTGWRHVAVWPLLVIVRFYRRWISPALPATCRFYPTCSSYGLTALTRFGPIEGTWLTLKRLARCHPWNPGGVDHVPPKGHSAHGEHGRSDAAPAPVEAKDD